MNQRERQQKEIATIKERTLIIKLSDADVLRVCEKAGAHNITVAEMVESYLQDLVCGTYTNGSDERDNARAYFERCYYGLYPEHTFLHYLIEWGSLQEYLENLDTAQDIQEDIAIYKKIEEPDTDEQAELEALQEDLEEVQGYIADYYKEYCASCHNREPEPLEDAQCSVLKWYAEYKAMKGEADE